MDPKIQVGDVTGVVTGGKTVMWLVSEVTTCPFGADLPEGFQDVTTPEDQKIGIRVGIKGKPCGE